MGRPWDGYLLRLYKTYLIQLGCSILIAHFQVQLNFTPPNWITSSRCQKAYELKRFQQNTNNNYPQTSNEVGRKVVRFFRSLILADSSGLPKDTGFAESAKHTFNLRTKIFKYSRNCQVIKPMNARLSGLCDGGVDKSST
jgi:hypothetical protein